MMIQAELELNALHYLKQTNSLGCSGGKILSGITPDVKFPF